MKKFPILITLSAFMTIGLTGCGCSQSTPIAYTVSFKNYDGTLLSESIVKSGETATYNGVTPTKPETSEYTYTFTGWDQSLENITSNCIRVAQFNGTLKPVTVYYTVTFKNYDGTLLQEVSVEEGHDAVYTASTPTRPTTPKYSYTFIGWDRSLENITSDCVRVAQFSETQIKYTVTFKNYDGTLLYEAYASSGDTVTYGGVTPTKPEDDLYTYTFSGWDHSLENISEDLICVAQFTGTLKPVTIYHKVIFKNDDGTLLQEVSVEDGKNALYTGATPTKTNTPEFEYTFIGWDESLENITSDCVRVAQYSKSNVEYTVKFYSLDNVLLYTDVVYYQEPANYYGDTPTKASTSTHYYTFTGWDKDLSSITKSITTKPIFEEHGISKQITLKPSNGESDSVLQVTYDESYDLGTPEFTGFTFLGWYINDTTSIPTTGTWTYSDVSVVTAKWGIGYYEFSENEDNGYTVSLTDLGKTISDLVIPSTFNNKLVTALGANFLKENTKINRITIPGTIKNIPNYSFYKCTNLTEVNLSDGLISIGEYAFAYCAFAKINIPSTCTTIGREAFEYNSNLYQTYIPSSVTSMGWYAFYSIGTNAYICLEHQAIPSSWPSSWSANTNYVNCTKLVDSDDYSYVIRSNYGDLSVVILRLSEETSKLQEFTVPSEIEGISDIRIGRYLFKGNKYIRSVNLTGVTRIYLEAFNGCSNLHTVTLSNSLIAIENKAFQSCTALTTLTIPNSVTEIMGFAFDSCSSLTYIYIPKETVTIGQYAFDACNKSSIYTNAHSASSGWENNWKGSQPIYYDFVSLDELEDFNYVVQSYMGDDYVTITSLKESAKAKKNIVIPDEIDGISDIRLPANLFKGLSELQSIDLGSGVTKIPNYCFANCTNLKSVILHDGVTSIGSYAFNNCSSLSSINMPSSLTSIGTQAFDYCTSLKEIIIPISVSTIGSYAFDVTDKLALLIEASTKQPGWESNWAGTHYEGKQYVYDYISSGEVDDFRYAKSSNGVIDAIHILGLKEGTTNVNLVVPNEIEGISNIKIADYAFDGNTILKTIDLGNSVTYIGGYAFRGNISLTSVIVSNSCAVIKNYAFRDCSTSCVINCEASELPSTWESNWNYSSCQVVWGYIRA